MKRHWLNTMTERLLSLIFPSGIYCICCGDLIDPSQAYGLCDTCVRALHWVDQDFCEKCGKETEAGKRLCEDCQSFPHVFKEGRSCVRYGLLERSMLHGFKYSGKDFLFTHLGEIMYHKLEAQPFEQQPELIVPVPMFPKKQRKRGYNQAELLARNLAERMGIPLIAGALIRTENTVPMSSLSAQERRENLKNVFTVAEKQGKIIADHSILLVDDIYTMGSTADACSTALLKGGARDVSVITFASGIDRG